MKKTWAQYGNDFMLEEISNKNPILEPKVFKINFNEMSGKCYLTHIMDKFVFPYKIYGVQNAFIDRVKKTYANTSGNLGILLNGVKGTGKSVTAELICNELNMPVLVVHSPYSQIPSFINEIQQDIIIVFDEFEKIYNNYDHSILTVMDGILNNEHRKTFLLTTNQLYINDNLLQRPGRVRYVKTFEDLTLDVIIEIIDDKLIHKELREECIKFISTLETITIDIVKAVTDEVNIHHESPENFKSVFNIHTINNLFNVFEVNTTTNTSEQIYSAVKINHNKLTLNIVNHYLEINNDYIGIIKNLIDDDTLLIEMVDDDEDDEKTVNKIYRFEKVEKQHKSFFNYNVL